MTRWLQTRWPVVVLVAFYLVMAGIAVSRPARGGKEPGLVILCEDGGAYRSLTQTEGFLASGGPCVLADRHGGRSTADSIICYDNANAAP